MTELQAWALVIAVFLAGFLLTKAVGDGYRLVAERIAENTKVLERLVTRLERIGTKLDSLWSPLQGISNAAHGKTGDDLD